MTGQARIAGQLFTVYTGNISPVNGMRFALDVFWHQFKKKKKGATYNVTISSLIHILTLSTLEALQQQLMTSTCYEEDSTQ